MKGKKREKSRKSDDCVTILPLCENVPDNCSESLGVRKRCIPKVLFVDGIVEIEIEREDELLVLLCVGCLVDEGRVLHRSARLEDV